MYPRDSGDLGDDDNPRKAKRARVSVACLECRKKKERCDGTHPVCTPCHKQNRQCYYSPPEKRRGLPTGYVRSLETLFGMLLHSIRGTEQSALTALRDQLKVQSTGSHTSHVPNGNYFIETWRNSEPYKDLERILVSTEGKESDSVAAKSLPDDKLESVIKGILSISTDRRSDSYSETSFLQNGVPVRTGASLQAITSVALNGEGNLPQHKPTFHQFQRPQLAGRRLPPDWHTLINRYYDHVHCWFPIIPKQDILRHAHVVSATGTSSTTLASGDVASLWAVFAHAIYCETSVISATEQDTGQQQQTHWSDILQEVLTLSMSSTAVAEAGHIQALLLSALLFISQGTLSQAWFLIGRAVYMLVDLGLTKHQSNTSLLHPSDKLERLSLGCFILDTLISCQLKRRPYLKTTDLYHIGLSSTDGIEEWESAHLETSNKQPMPPSPAKVLSCFSTFVEQVSVLNDFIHFSNDTIDHQTGNSMIEAILRLGTPHFPSQLTSIIPLPTPQSLNILFATASFSKFMWNSIVTLSGNSNIVSPWSILPGLPESFNQQLQENHHRYKSPLYDIYLRLCTNGNKMSRSQQNSTVKVKSTFETMLNLLQNDCSFSVPKLDQAISPDNLVPASTLNTTASMEPTAGTDLYHSLITLDDINWPDASRVFLENLGMMQGDISLDDENLLNF